MRTENGLNWSTVLLVFIPLAVAFEYLHFDPLWIFLGSAAAIIPLAKWMGVATEELSFKMGYGLGGLLNATFGNATELIIAVLRSSKGSLSSSKPLSLVAS